MKREHLMQLRDLKLAHLVSIIPGRHYMYLPTLESSIPLKFLT